MEVCEAEGEKKLTFTEHLLGSRHYAGIFHPQWVFAVFAGSPTSFEYSYS